MKDFSPEDYNLKTFEHPLKPGVYGIRYGFMFTYHGMTLKTEKEWKHPRAAYQAGEQFIYNYLHEDE